MDKTNFISLNVIKIKSKLISISNFLYTTFTTSKFSPTILCLFVSINSFYHYYFFFVNMLLVFLFVKFCSLLPSLDFSLWVMFDSVAGSVELKWVLFVSCYEFGLGFRFEVFVSLWIWGNVLETSTVIQLGFLIIVFRWSVCVWLYDRLRWPHLILRMWVALLSFSMFLLS